MDDILEPLVPEGTVAQPPAPPGRRRFLPYAMLGVALAIAAGGYYAGHASAGSTSGTQTVAADNAVNAYLAQASVPATSAAACVAPRRGVAGTLKAVNGTSLTIARAGGGSVSVKTSPSTIIRRTVLAKTSDVKNGLLVAVQGTSSGQNAIAAQQVALLPTGAGPGPGLRSPPGGGRFGGRAAQTGFAVGTVTKASSGTFTVDLPDGTSVAVTTSASTKVVSTVDSALKDLVIGQPTVVLGNVNTDGSVSATQVAQGSADLGFGFNKGFGFGAFGRFGGPRGDGHGPAGPGMTPLTPAAPASVS